MKTSFKELMANAVLSVVEQTTERERSSKKEKGAEPKFSPATINLLKSANSNIGGSIGALIAAVVKDLTGNDELEVAITGGAGQFPIFCCVVMTTNSSGIGIHNKPVVVTNSKNRHILGSDGQAVWSFSPSDKPRLGTAEEAEKMVKEFTDAQWATIMSNPIFEGIRKAAMDTPIQLVEAEKEGK